MSAFDDEFGLFGDELQTAEEDENRSTLGARVITSGNEIVIDEIEPEDEDRRPRGRGNGTLTPSAERPRGQFRRRAPDEPRRPSTTDPEELRTRAIELLAFLAKGLVTKPDVIFVQAHEDQRQGLVLELEVAAEDLGKVIGRGGRVAQALRTVVRAGVEGRVAIEIIDVETDANGENEVALTVNDATEHALQDDENGNADALEILADDVIAEPGTPTLRRPGRVLRPAPAVGSSAKAKTSHGSAMSSELAESDDTEASLGVLSADSEPVVPESAPRRRGRPAKAVQTASAGADDESHGEATAPEPIGADEVSSEAASRPRGRRPRKAATENA